MEKEKKQSAFSELMSYAGKYKILTYFSILFSVIAGIVVVMPFVYLGKIIKEVINVYPDFSKATHIVSYGWMAVAFSIGYMAIYFCALACSHLSAFRVAKNMKKALLYHIAKLPIGFSDEIGSGKIRRIVSDETGNTEIFLAHNLPDIVQAITVPIVLIIMFFTYDFRFGIATLVPLFLGFIAMGGMFGSGMAESMRKYQDALESMSNESVEYVRGIPVVKTFGQTVFSFHRFKKSIDDYGKFCIDYSMRCRWQMILYETAINSTFAFLIGLVLLLTSRQGMKMGILIDFLFYVIVSPVITTSMQRIMFISENALKINDTLARINSILTLEPLMETNKNEVPNGASVELVDVKYQYKEDAKPALNHLSLKANKDEMIALVGPSGSGKTTAAELISRFFDPDEGDVKIGGIDVKNIAKDKLMETVSYVFQDSKLLKRTIADNLRIAKPDATDDELYDALHRAQCDDIIRRLQNGINTMLGNEGTYLSGGEQQRIAIARTMLKNAPVVILDEATAFADPENEMLVQKAFAELTKKSTVIMIAHRLSTVRNADRIYVFNRGKVVESGKHDELVSKKGLYFKMWKEYQSAANWKVGEAV